MNNRFKLQKILEDIIGSKQVYYQPPESIKLKYPAIIYSLDNVANKFANNETYILDDRYSIILIDNNPDTDLVRKILSLRKSRFDRRYISDNLIHNVFTIYF